MRLTGAGARYQKRCAIVWSSAYCKEFELPELPEVETVVRGLRAAVTGASIAQLKVSDPRLEHLLEERLEGCRIGRARRRGKSILLPLDDGRTLRVHLMMSGRLLLRGSGAPPDRFQRVGIGLGDGNQLRFCDPRRFGTMVVLSPGELKAAIARLGPEPLSGRFRAVDLGGRLAGRRGVLKTTLLDQKVLAGVGNIYADEALWRARLHPLQPAGLLTYRQTQRLHRTLRSVMRKAIEMGGTTFGIYADAHGQDGAFQAMLMVFRRTGQPCPRCRATIQRVVVGGRATHFCPNCQALPPAAKTG